MIALVYYHHCSNNPKSYVFSDENLIYQESDAHHQIENILEEPPSLEKKFKTQSTG